MKPEKTWIQYSIALILLALFGMGAMFIFSDLDHPVPTVEKEIKPEPPKASFNAENQEKSTTSTTTPQFQWRAGTRQVYDYHAHTDTEINATLGLNGVDKWKKATVDIKGVLNMRFFGQKSDQVYVGFQMSPVQIEASQKRLPDIEKMYQKRFFMVSLTLEGQPKAFFFPAGLQQDDRKTLIDIVNGLQIYLPSQPAEEWTIQEKDIAGEYEAVYSTSPISKAKLTAIEKTSGIPIYKQKIHYTSVSHTKQKKAQPDVPLNINVVQSDVKATIADQYAWFKTVSSHEKLERRIGNKLLTKTRNDLTVSISSRSINPDLAIWQADADPEKVILAFKQDKTKQLSVAEIREERLKTHLKKQFADVETTALIQPVMTFDSKKSSMASIMPAIRALEKYLSVYPEASAEIVTLLQQEAMSPSSSALIIGALKDVGHLEAQSALVDIFLASEPAKNEQAPIQAIAMTTQLDKPAPLLIDALRTMTQQEDENADMALLALGAVSHRLVEDAPGEAVALRQEIMDYLQTQTAPDKQEMALRALGNTRSDDVELVEVVTPYLETDHENVRAATYGVFSHFNDQTSLEHLITGATTEDSNYAQRKALEALSVREDVGEAVMPISQQIAQESDETVRQTMIGFLGKNKAKHPQVVDVLKQQLTLETSRDMKKEVYKALYSN